MMLKRVSSSVRGIVHPRYRFPIGGGSGESPGECWDRRVESPPMVEAQNEELDTLPLEEVRRLVDLLKESGVGEIQVRKGDLEISVKAQPEISEPRYAPAATPVTEVVAGESAPEENGLHAVLSPLVGTFFRSPGPGEGAYVEVGDKVVAGQVLCIVEAMKLMNEIPADVDGEVVEVLAENSGGVQYGQPLFHLRPES